MREPFSFLKVISWISHTILTFIIFMLLGIVISSAVYYAQHDDWPWALASFALFIAGLLAYANAWRLRRVRF
jgi:membrane protein YdbS with pleckstrin-like domain